MGGSGSKPSTSNSKENAELNNHKPTSKDNQLPTPFIIENVSLTPDPSPSRRRRFSRKAAKDKTRVETTTDDDIIKTAETKTTATTTAATQVVDQNAGTRPHSKSPREPSKIETLVRDGVTNISKTLKDWTMISSRGSRSAAPVILADRKRSSSPTISTQRKTNNNNNQFNFHHASYLAQTKQEKNSNVDFSAPRHLNSVTRQSSHDYTSSKQRDATRKSGYSSQQARSRQPSPDHIPAPRKHGNKKDKSGYKTTNSRQNSPSYLYSLELKQGSSEQLPEASAMYITSSGKLKSPEYMSTYLGGNATPSRDNVNIGENCSSEFANDIGESVSLRYVDTYCNSVDKEGIPMFLPAIQQEMVVQRVEVKSDLDFETMKPETIRVNGIEFVRKKSNHPLMKQLLTIDKDRTKMSTVLSEKPERDQTCRRASKEAKNNINVNSENRVKSYGEKELRITLERSQRKAIEKDADKRETNKCKTRDGEIGIKEVSKLVHDKPMSDTKFSRTNNTARPDAIRKGVETKQSKETDKKTPSEARNLKRDESPTKVVDKKDKSRRDSKGEVVRDKNDANNANSGETNKGDTRKDANTRDKNSIDSPKRHEREGRTIEIKNLTKADREIIKQCRIRHMPIAVSSHGRLFLPSAKFVATPLAVMRDSAMKVSACASEKSYCRVSRTQRLSPNRLRRPSPPSANRGPAQQLADQLARQRLMKEPSGEHQKTPTRVQDKESKENVSAENNLVQRSSNKTPNRTPRSTSPIRNQNPVEGQMCPKTQANTKQSPNSSRETPPIMSSKELTTVMEQASVSQKGEDKSNRNVDIRCKSSPNQSKRSTARRSGEEESSSTGNSNSSSQEKMVKCKSEKSVDVWFSRSVRSKNKIFETIIEKTASAGEQQQQQQQPHCRASRRSSPQSQISDSPFSKAIKLKYRAISAKRISKVSLRKAEKKVPPPPPPPSSTSTVAAPQVFTPWDSCMMFKPKHVRPPSQRSKSPGRTLRHTSPHRARKKSPVSATNYVWNKAADTTEGNVGGRPKHGPKSPPWTELPDTLERKPATPKLLKETCQVMRSLQHEARSRQMMECSCDLESCNCIEVMSRCSRSRNGALSPVSSRYGYSKLNREKVQDFEKKFRNTHVYRSVTGVVCKKPSGNVSCKDNHVKALAHNKKPSDMAKAVCTDVADPGKRQKKRCPSCGNNSDASDRRRRGGRRCADCGGPLDKSSSTDSVEGGGGATATRSRRGERCCSNCGEQHDMRGCTVQCCVHCGGECCSVGGRGENDEQPVSGHRSSSSISASSGKVPSYRKVLKMFETKSKLTQAATAVAVVSSVSPQRSSKQIGGSGGTVREVTRPASHFDRHRLPRSHPFTGEEEVERTMDRRPLPAQPRDVIIERRRPHAHCHDSSDDDDNERMHDPHFNRSEQELFKNARLQWIARDQQKRPRHHQQQVRTVANHTASTKRVVTRGGKLAPPSSKTQDSASGK